MPPEDAKVKKGRCKKCWKKFICVITCGGLIRIPLKKVCFCIPLRLGILLVAIFFLIVDSLLVLSCGERLLTTVQEYKNKFKKDPLKKHSSYEDVPDPGRRARSAQTSGGLLTALQNNSLLLPQLLNIENINEVQTSLVTETQTLEGRLGSAESDNKRNEENPTQNSPNRTLHAGEQRTKARQENINRIANPATKRTKLPRKGDKRKDEKNGTKSETLIYLQLQNLLVAAGYWLADALLLLCVICNNGFCAVVWVVVMVIRLVELAAEIMTIYYTCNWKQNCLRYIFPNILSVVTGLMIPYGILVCVSWIIS